MSFEDSHNRHVAQARAEKDFNLGMQMFQQGYERSHCVLISQSVMCGWDAAQEMQAVKVRYLEIARNAALADLGLPSHD